MVSVEDIDRTILELEQKDTSFAVCERLAWMYIVRDHLGGGCPQVVAVVSSDSDSEFTRKAKRKPYAEVLGVFDNLMDILHSMKPTAYEAVLGQLDSIPDV